MTIAHLKPRHEIKDQQIISRRPCELITLLDGSMVVIADEIGDAAIVDAIVKHVEGRVFNCKELWRHAKQAEGPLRDVLSHVKDRNELGQVLRRIRGKVFDGFVIKQNEKRRTNEGAQYHVVRVEK